MEDAAEFAALLSDADYDVESVAFDGGHVHAPTELSLPTIVEALGQQGSVTGRSHGQLSIRS